VDACLAQDAVPEEWERYVEINAAHYR
jgi:hypothetical protein